MTSLKAINRIFISFLVGGAVGTSIALLYAPMKGKYLRKDIGRKTHELIKEGKKITRDSWNDAKEKTEEIFGSANDILNSNIGKIVRKTEILKDAINRI